MILFSNKHAVPLKLFVDDEKWANITLIYQRRIRKLTVLSGDRLLGCYIVPAECVPRKLLSGSSARFACIKYYNCARKIVLPEKAQNVIWAPAVISSKIH